MRARVPAFLLPLLVAFPALALDIPANARLAAERISPSDRYAAPVGVFDGTAIPVEIVEGAVTRRAWRIPAGGATAAQITARLRAGLQADGFEIVLDCADRQCGGFDFRFGTEVLPGPAMFVSLDRFYFVTARRGADRLVTLLVSGAREVIHVQTVEVDRTVQPAAPAAPRAGDRPAPEGDGAGFGFAEVLSAEGFHVLDGVDFASGSTELEQGSYPVLAELARFLEARPGVRVALVGHTDSVGPLEQNIAISRARARSVRQRLIETHGVDPLRVDAEGMGYLAPRKSNLTAAGREANRRVEVILLSGPEE